MFVIGKGKCEISGKGNGNPFRKAIGGIIFVSGKGNHIILLQSLEHDAVKLFD